MTQHISVNNYLTLSVFFRCPGVPSCQTIAVSMMMSMAIVLQIFLSCVVICIERTLKPKTQTDLGQSPYGYLILENTAHNSLNTRYTKNYTCEKAFFCYDVGRLLI